MTPSPDAARVEALRKYGRHENNCKHYNKVFGVSHECDCGLDAALSGGEPTPGGQRIDLTTRLREALAREHHSSVWPEHDNMTCETCALLSEPLPTPPKGATWEYGLTYPVAPPDLQREGIEQAARVADMAAEILREEYVEARDPTARGIRRAAMKTAEEIAQSIRALHNTTPPQGEGT